MQKMELVEMAKMTDLIRENTLINCNADWKPFLDFLCETEKKTYDIWP